MRGADVFARLLINALARRRGRKLLALTAVWIGVTLVVAMLALSIDVGDAMSREVLSFGANLRIEPLAASIPVRLGGRNLAEHEAPAYLDESRLDAVRTIFWRNNVLAVVARLWVDGRVNGRPAPLLGVPLAASPPEAGHDPLAVDARTAYGHWHVEGSWPHAANECLAGSTLATTAGVRSGDRVAVRIGDSEQDLTVTGTVATGDREDDAIVMPLQALQRLAGLTGRISEADVSALTTPENRLAEKFHQDPKSLTPAEYERWYCTPYPGSVAADIQKAVPGSAVRVVRKVTESQGAVLSRLGSLMLLLAMLTLLASCLSIAGVLTAAVIERRGEIALMQAIGAPRSGVLLLFLAEASVLGLAGGVLAAGSGALLAAGLVRAIFGAPPELHAAVLLLAPLLGVGTAWLGSIWPVWRTLGLDTAPLLHGGA